MQVDPRMLFDPERIRALQLYGPPILGPGEWGMLVAAAGKYRELVENLNEHSQPAK